MLKSYWQYVDHRVWGRFGKNVMTQPGCKGLMETMISKIANKTFILPQNVTGVILYGQHSLHVQVSLLVLAVCVCHISIFTYTSNFEVLY